MMIVPAGVTVHLALGVTDMQKGMDGLGRGLITSEPEPCRS